MCCPVCDQDKWVEARLLSEVGYITDGEVLCVKQAGLAIVKNVVFIRSVQDLYTCLRCDVDPTGMQLRGLGVPLVTGRTALESLSISTNGQLSADAINRSGLVLFNLHFLSGVDAVKQYFTEQ